MKTMFLSNMMIGLAVGLGLLLMWIGALIWGFSSDSDVKNIGMAIRSFGMLALVGAMILGGILRDDMERWIRLAMMLGGVLLLIFIGFWTGFWTALTVSFTIPSIPGLA